MRKQGQLCSLILPIPPSNKMSNYVLTTSICMSQRRRRYSSNETPNDVSVERWQDVSVVHLHDVLLKRRDDVSRVRNNDAPSVRFHDISNKAQIKYVSGTSPRRPSGTYPKRPISSLYGVFCKSQMKQTITSL